MTEPGITGSLFWLSPTLAEANGRRRRATRPSRCRVSTMTSSHSIILLRDLQKLFVRYDGENLPSAFIAERLATMEERPWPAFAYGKPITPHSIARLLKPFNVRPRQIRLPESGKRGQGYLAEQFRHVFKRYLQDWKTSSASPDKPIKSKASDEKASLTGRRAVRGLKAA